MSTNGPIVQVWSAAGYSSWTNRILYGNQFAKLKVWEETSLCDRSNGSNIFGPPRDSGLSPEPHSSKFFIILRILSNYFIECPVFNTIQTFAYRFVWLTLPSSKFIARFIVFFLNDVVYCQNSILYLLIHKRSPIIMRYLLVCPYQRRPKTINCKKMKSINIRNLLIFEIYYYSKQADFRKKKKHLKN